MQRYVQPGELVPGVSSRLLAEIAYTSLANSREAD